MNRNPSMTPASAPLRRLEKRVHKIVETLNKLREENRQLKNRLQALQNATRPGKPAEGEGWLRERREVQKRVERLAAGLGKLLEG